MTLPWAVVLWLALWAAYELGGYVMFRRVLLKDWAKPWPCRTCGNDYNIIHKGACPNEHVLPRPRAQMRAHNARPRQRAREGGTDEEAD